MAQRHRTIYLDNHATTRLDPRVLEAMLPWLTDRYGNAGSVTHEMGREAREAVDESRAAFAAAIGAEPREIVFTGGATESANLAILGTASRSRAATGGVPRGRVVTLATEHHAVLDPVEHLEREGFAVTRLPVVRQGDSDGVPGRVRLADLEAALTPDTFLVSVLLANNEIGVVQDMPAIAERVRASNAVLHVDCAQALGRLPVDVDALGADLASFSGHKFHGPKGAGALYVRRRRRAVRIDPLVFGGGQERGLRSGTLDVPAIVGIAEAARLANDGLAAEVPRMRSLRDRLWERLRAAVPDVAVNGPPLDGSDERGQPVPKGHSHALRNDLPEDNHAHQINHADDRGHASKSTVRQPMHHDKSHGKTGEIDQEIPEQDRCQHAIRIRHQRCHHPLPPGAAAKPPNVVTRQEKQ